uniref:Uncharacterized protein n=1 Tax=Globodera rostochiensis TaxID=31243 RepID=A0A914IDA6_GLORO
MRRRLCGEWRRGDGESCCEEKKPLSRRPIPPRWGAAAEHSLMLTADEEGGSGGCQPTDRMNGRGGGTTQIATQPSPRGWCGEERRRRRGGGGGGGGGGR